MALEERIRHSMDVIRQADERYSDGFMTFSGGKDSTVLLDLVYGVNPGILIVSIDTGFEYEETIKFINETVEKYSLNHIYIKPSEEDKQAIDRLYGDKFIFDGRYKCCEHKKPTMNKFLLKNNFSYWVTGLRREETPNRRNLSIVQDVTMPEANHLIISKINPLALWKEGEIWLYIKENKLSYHPLYDKGFKSLGCKPCTDAGFREGRANQGKFEEVGTSLECGLHI